MNLLALALLQSLSFGASVVPAPAPAIAGSLRPAAAEAVVVAPALDAHAQLVTAASVVSAADEYPSAWPRVFEGRATGKYYGARYYSSAQGRFTSVDPGGAGASVGEPQSWNGYSYGLNNPLRFNDPNGRAPKDVLVGGKNFVVNAARGAASLIETVALDIFMPSVGGSRTQAALSAPLDAAFEDYSSKGVSGVGNQLLDQGEAGATEIVTEAILTGGAFVAPAAKGASAPNLPEVAGRVHGALDPIAQRMRTTAAGSGTDAAGGSTVIVGSSRPTLSPAQRGALRPGETAARGLGHAEATVVAAAKQAGVKINSIAVSRPPCPACDALLKREGITVRD